MLFKSGVLLQHRARVFSKLYGEITGCIDGELSVGHRYQKHTALMIRWREKNEFHVRNSSVSAKSLYLLPSSFHLSCNYGVQPEPEVCAMVFKKKGV